jgi:2-polyprenyl-3-methyl-5-hydroxy-6-metoxy-1,4-benzoquinol methylase
MLSSSQSVCLLCHSPALRQIKRQSRLVAEQCTVCGLLFSKTVATADEGFEGAVSTDPGHFNMLIDRDNEWRDIMRPMIAERQNEMSRLFDVVPQDWIEIGPGNGGLESILREQGFNWVGVEIEPRMAKRMQSAAKNVHCGDFTQMDVRALMPDHVKKKGGFDVAYFSQVFEHVVEPTTFLKNVFASLRPGGVVYVDVPNNDGLTAMLRKWNPQRLEFGEIVPPHHMIAYGAKTLEFALRRTGFEKVEVFASSYDNARFGLAHARMDTRLRMRLIWGVSRLLGLGGNLVGLAAKPIT